MSIITPDNPQTDELPPNTPLPMDLFIAQLKRFYCVAYVEEALRQQRDLATLRPDLEADIDYDEETDRLFVWFEDPTYTTSSGASYSGAALTSYPDTLRNTSTHAPKDVIAWVMMRAAAHSNYDAEISRYRSPTQLRPKLMCGVRYVMPPTGEASASRSKRRGTKGDEVL